PDQPPRTLSASGKVVDATGKPVAGATVYLREWALVRKTYQPHEQEIKDILATTTTDEQGAFAFGKVPLPKPYLDELARTMPAPWDLLFTAKGHGLAWERLPPKNQPPPPTLPLRPGARLQGQFASPAGEPVAGARVQVLRFQGLDQPLQSPATTPVNLSLDWSQLALTAASDTDRRFRLEGLPDNMRVTLLITAARAARQMLYAATTAKAQANVVVGRTRSPQGVIVPREEPVDTGDFTVTLQPGHRLRLRVVGETTGQPVAGAFLSQLTGPTPYAANPKADA